MLGKDYLRQGYTLREYSQMLTRAYLSSRIKVMEMTCIKGSENMILGNVVGGGGSKITVDTTLSSTSENPISNNAVATALENTVQLEEQTLTEDQKAQARANIDASKLPTPTPTDSGKALVVDESGAYVLGEAGAKDAVLYTAQTLTEDQKAQARANIGAGDAEVPASNVTAGTFAGQVQANADAAASLDTAQVRNIRIGTEEMSSDILSAMNIGDVYYKYEVT